MHGEVYWTALICEPAREYLAQSELQRRGLNPYLPQARRRYHPPRTTTVLQRKYPLFPGYILLPLVEIDHELLREARGLRPRPLLADSAGNPWRAQAFVIEQVVAAEQRGDFDEVPVRRGEKLTLKQGVMRGMEAVNIVSRALDASTLQILLPLFGGVRASIAQAQVMRA